MALTGSLYFLLKTISLTQGKTALVDDEDFDYLNEFAWRVQVKHHTCGDLFYAIRHGKTGEKETVLMHVEVALRAGLSGKFDHRDNDGLNNQRSNLRVATKQQNAWNSRKMGNTTSEFKGVSWDASKRKWRSQILIDGKILSRRFLTEIEAAAYYAAEAIFHHGEFANV